MPALTVKEIAALCDGVIEGDPHALISGANTLEDAQASELAFVDSPKAARAAGSSKAGCLLVYSDFQSQSQRTLVRLKTQPRLAFARVLGPLYKEASPKPPHIHPTAIVSPSATVPKDCSVGAYTTIGHRTVLGEGCSIGAGCTVGNDVSIGSHSTLYDHVTVYRRVTLGARVILHSGCVIGADGFGFARAGDHYEKFPQVGTVDIGDDVEVGANSCVDRAALGVTRIGNGSKLDNLVHVAHNCDIGKHVVIAAQTGFSGGVTVGDYAVIGGQVGVADKARIAAHAVIGAQSGIVTGQRIDAGEPVWGTPARPIRQHLKGLAYVGRLGEAFYQLKEIKKRLDVLEAAFGTKEA